MINDSGHLWISGGPDTFSVKAAENQELEMTDKTDDTTPETEVEEDTTKGARQRFLSPVQRRLLQGGMKSLKENGPAYDSLKNR